jgi:hypothetical protein
MSRSRSSFRPQLEVLEGRAVPSGLAPTRGFIPTGGLFGDTRPAAVQVNQAATGGGQVIVIESNILKRWN